MLALERNDTAERLAAEASNRRFLAALAREAFREGVLLNGMQPDEQYRLAKSDGWQGRVVGASRWAGGA